MNNPIPNITDEVGEQLKDFGKVAKKQVTGDDSTKPQENIRSLDDARDKKDPITGKKPPTKQQLSTLQQQTAQLAQARLKKVREELEKQRIQVTQAKQVNQVQSGLGPEVKKTEKKQDDAVAKTLKASKSTGEFKGLIGG